MDSDRLLNGSIMIMISLETETEGFWAFAKIDLIFRFNPLYCCVFPYNSMECITYKTELEEGNT